MKTNARTKKHIAFLGFAAVLTLSQAVGAFSNSPVLSLYQNQQNFLDMRFGMFIHFNLGTFDKREWAPKGENPLIFDPPSVSCDQWAAAAASAGMKFAVLTTKHHDGFALWPTKYQTKNTFGTYQNVMYSGFKQDVVKLYVDAFRKAGISPCLYFSIRDLNEPILSGITPAQVAVKMPLILGQLTELLTNYGDIQFLMFDGWTWETGRNAIATQIIRDSVRKLQPNILIGDHTGMCQPFGVDIMNFEHFSVAPSNTYAATEGFQISGVWFYYGNGGAGTGTVRPSSWIAGNLKGTEPVWTNFLLNCPPNNQGVIDNNMVNSLKGVPALWKPNSARKPLPDPGPQMDDPITPVGITATSTAAGFPATNAIDGKSDWVSGKAVQYLWKSAKAPSATSPEGITLDLGKVYDFIDLFEYEPSQSRTTGNDITTVNDKGGFITKYAISTSLDNKTFTKVAEGSWAVDGLVKKVTFPKATARYVKLDATATYGNGPAVIQEVDVGGSDMNARLYGTTSIRSRLENLLSATCRSLPSGGLQIEAPGEFSYRILNVAGSELESGTGENMATSNRNFRPGVYMVQVRSPLHADQTLKVLRN